ncbi:MAG: hypothetical protein A2Y29_04785 [Spirochaetes bacterium GWE2_31_10]|nr:MAG: hypothetical protein A2Y29_04785 [Spirochaetes bacterium GWE2_31_10]
MNISIRMAADKYNIELNYVEVNVGFNRKDPENPILEYKVIFDDQIAEKDKIKLLSVVEMCSVRSTLSKQLRFKSLE